MSLANAVFMVRPQFFAFNTETGVDNHYQQSSELSPEALIRKACDEYSTMVSLLKKNDVDVIEYALKDLPACPDAVFPNNWFTTDTSGRVFLFPMASEVRRKEVNPNGLARALESAGYRIDSMHYVSSPNETSLFLEGTGAMIFDHEYSRIYAGLSERCCPEMLARFGRLSGYEEVFAFETQDSDGHPIYHTNVMMSIGQSFVVICTDAIVDATMKDKVLSSLSVTKDVIEITQEQVSSFCGNILNISNKHGDSLIVMSESAYQGFSPEQREQLTKHGKILRNPIPNIEQVGGGSCRCMLAEVFLPQG